MPLPHNALVLVADGRKMLFFRNNGDENQIDLRTEAHDQREDRKDSEIKTDAPGGTHQSAGYGRSTYEETDFHQQEEDRWIKDAADELKKRVLRGDFEALAIIAPPKALGVLIFYLIYVNVENAYLTPRIMRSSVNLLGLSVLIALLATLSPAVRALHIDPSRTLRED